MCTMKAGVSLLMHDCGVCVCVCGVCGCCQEKDEERRRQLRERARQLIAEARSGVRMAEMPLYGDTTAGDKLKARKILHLPPEMLRQV
ncbi:hypothetical protein Z043_113952 [Scleropages formosus]|uniref:Uncharacterized protein n=1 Tax=Scleropages formosus TaxID=113540 RepID=A0A0P7WZL9_SCLFO|nr:hypothetical protein Z043_113952 [Scleropages formosus]